MASQWFERQSFYHSECESEAGYPRREVEWVPGHGPGRVYGRKDIEDYTDAELTDAALILDRLHYNLPEELIRTYGREAVYRSINAGLAGVTAERYRRTHK